MKPSVLVLAATLGVAATAPALAQGQGSHFFDSWDANSDGQVTLVEITERRDDVFSSFDSDENEFLDAAEYVLFDEAREQHHADTDTAQRSGQGRKGNGKGGEMMTLAANDLDQDNKVSRAEFVGNAKVMFANLDKNADGVVTTADFKKR